jgi:hypothetical protein
MSLSEAVVHATALAHAVDGAELSLADGQGRRVWVARHPSADVDPCRWRSFVCSRIASEPGIATEVVALSGRLRAMDSGGFADQQDPSLRWFATRLCPNGVAVALQRLWLDEIPEDAVTATIRPDPALGVTVIGLRIDAPCLYARLGDLVAAAIGACLVAELEMMLARTWSQS